jgi:hypothetical protein
VPLRLNHTFFTEGRYVAQARSYREFFSHRDLQPLRDYVASQSAVSSLKNRAYVYLLGPQSRR